MAGMLSGRWSCPGCNRLADEVELVTVQTPAGPITLCEGCSPGV